MQTVVETASYLTSAKDAGMTDADRGDVVSLLSADPQAGVVMSGTGGCRKIRIAGRGKGKRGGYRVVFAFGGNDIPVFLITVFGKNEKDNLSKAERNELAKLTDVLFKTYRSKVETVERKKTP